VVTVNALFFQHCIRSYIRQSLWPLDTTSWGPQKAQCSTCKHITRSQGWGGPSFQWAVFVQHLLVFWPKYATHNTGHYPFSPTHAGHESADHWSRGWHGEIYCPHPHPRLSVLYSVIIFVLLIPNHFFWLCIFFSLRFCILFFVLGQGYCNKKHLFNRVTIVLQLHTYMFAVQFFC